MGLDPTKVEMWVTDPLVQRFQGWTRHDNLYFDVPYMTHLDGNLWMGGCQDGLVLPEHIKTVVSVYPWERYIQLHDAKYIAFEVYDSTSGFDPEVYENIAKEVYDACQEGPTLIHCQAGLNRSSLVAGLALLQLGAVSSGEEAVAFIRNKRSVVCLCNPVFRQYLEEK